MAKELLTATDPTNQDIMITVFSGIRRGPCVQLTQKRNHEFQMVQLTKSQVIQQIATLQMWLDQ
jgi:hypothetical protein